MKSIPSLRRKKILITCGPTWVPIDDMRVISNRSSGVLGQTLALMLAQLGAHVTVLEGPVEKRLVAKRINIIPFYFFDDLQKLLWRELDKNYDAVVHAAAVSDYKLRKPLKGKLSSSLRKFRLELIPTEKLIRGIKKRAPKIFLVGFKLEPFLSKTIVQRKAASLIKESGCGAVVVNQLDGGYRGYVITPDGKISPQAVTREQMAKQIMDVLKESL